jgi:N-methylhydantoinase B
VSVAAAEAEYGVVIDNGVIDVAATTTTRAAPHRRERGAHFDFGPEREVHEMLWTRENYGALTTILLALPVHWRFFVKSKIFELLPKQAARGDNRPRVHDAFAAVREAYPQVPGIDL